MRYLHYDPDGHIKRILIVGIGGTGSVMARHVGSILFDMQQRDLDTPQVYLIDGDTVDHSNCGRQPFSLADIGAPKAQLVAQRLNYALGLDVIYDNRMFVAEDWRDYGYTSINTLVIGCVDNHLARREIDKLPNAIWLDLGNHYASGQICIGNSNYKASWIDNDSQPDRKTISSLPKPSLVLPTLLEPEPQTGTAEMSCAQLIERGTQHLLVNQLMGTVGATYVYTLLHRQPIDTFLSHVSVSPPGIRNELISVENLRSYLGDKDEKATQ